MKNNLIIGAGEIGHCISKIVQGLTVFHDPSKGFDIYHMFYDPSVEECEFKDFEVMHICFPCVDQNRFIGHVNSYIMDCNPKAVFIHSTVPVGTTRQIQAKNENIPIIYSPVRGRHVTLPDHVRKFTKYFAVFDIMDDSNDIIDEVFPFIEYHLVDDYESVELGKIMSTTYLGWCLLYEKEMYKICKENNIDFDLAYREFNETYNEMCNDEVYPERFKRPIYDHVDGEIGGHCVMPNLELNDNFITKTMKGYFNGSKSD